MANQNYCDRIMRNELDSCSDEELASVLVTPDGRGKENKKKALDILLKRYHSKGFQDGYESEYVGDLK